MDEDEESSYLNGNDANEGPAGANRRQRRGTGLYDAWNRKIKQLRFVKTLQFYAIPNFLEFN